MEIKPLAAEKSQKDLFAEWDRMNTMLFRFWTNYEEQGKTLKNIEAVKAHDEKFRREVQFLIRSSCDPGFHIFLNNRLNYVKEDGRKTGLIIRKHMRQLAKFILYDKLLQNEGKFVKLSDSLRKDEEYKSYGHLLRMVNDYYPEIMTKKGEIQQRTGRRKWTNGRKIEDHRQRIVETQFSKEEKLPTGIFDLIVARAMRKDATEDFFSRMHMQIEELLKAMICDPIDLTKLLRFKEDVLQIIEEIGVNPFLEGDSEEMDEQIFNLLVQMLFQQVRLLVELRWFREKSPSIQLKIIFKEPTITEYHKKDAAKAVSLNWLWFKDSDKVMKSMIIAGKSFITFRRKPEPKVAIWLIEECLKQLSYPEEEKALACYNIAMGYQQANELRLMMKWLKKAQELWVKVGGHPGDIADTYAYMAEYWRPTDTAKYLSYREKAEELLKKDTTLTQRRKAFHLKFFADCAALFKDKTWETDLYEKGLLLSSKIDSLEDFANWFNQCLDDLERFGERGPQGGLGRFAAPEDMDEVVISSSFRTGSYGPDSGN